MKESLCCIDDAIDCCSYIEGTLEKSFSFTSNNPTEALINNAPSLPQKTYGTTPAINGEYFNIKRSYQLRESTLRKLIELKGLHPDINVHLNTIIDRAITNLYDHVKNGEISYV